MNGDDAAAGISRVGRKKASGPFALAGAGVVSLLVFAAAGSALRGLREKEPAPRPAPSPSVATPQAHARGKLVFQVQCARCHGPEGHGDGPDAATLRPPPRDLTTAPWRTAATSEAIRRTVSEGVPGTMMPGLAAALSPRELDAVVDFVLSIVPEGAGGASRFADLLKGAGFTPARADRAAPRLSARGVDNDSLGLDRLRGKLVLIVFWGTTCAPCVEELPALEALARRFQAEGLEVVPVCVDESDAAVVRRVAASRAPGLPVYTDPSGSSKLSYDVSALPAAAIVAPDGRLLGSARGSARWSTPGMDALIRSSLPRPTAPAGK
jgi:mono/diheme cytochrome c family protein/peroxiredoxin